MFHTKRTAMSHWGARTGYGYQSDRVAFLRQMYKSESRARLQSHFATPEQLQNGLRPRQVPLMTPMPPPQSIPTPAAEEDPYAAVDRAPASPVHLPTSSPTINWPSVMTTQAIAYRAHDPEFVKKFSAKHGHARSHDNTTEYREHLFNVWNISGQKVPASFRP